MLLLLLLVPRPTQDRLRTISETRAALGLRHLIDSDLPRPVRWKFCRRQRRSVCSRSRPPACPSPTEIIRSESVGRMLTATAVTLMTATASCMGQSRLRAECKDVTYTTKSLPRQQPACRLSSAHVCVRIALSHPNLFGLSSSSSSSRIPAFTFSRFECLMDPLPVVVSLAIASHLVRCDSSAGWSCRGTLLRLRPACPNVFPSLGLTRCPYSSTAGTSLDRALMGLAVAGVTD